ncbi:hypothetical protein [Pseudooceanicola sp. MF1-13]|uniref:hypothetical protein n=1 Tax=Pseudooceanicola sp. MF1-13 TaxID=3379095 RepID=UPI003891E746
MRQYFAHAELDISGDARTRFALEMHHISEDQALADLESGESYVLVLDFDGDRLTGAMTQTGPDEDFDSDPLDENVVAASTLTPITTPPLDETAFQMVDDGPIRIGGHPPEGFKYPDTSFTSGLQYIGSIGAEGTGTGTVPLLYPVFVDYHPPVFLDVSDPLAPRLLPPSEGRMLDWGTPHRPLTTDQSPYGPVQESASVAEAFANRPEVLWREQAYTLMPRRLGLDEFPGWDGLAGVPDWVQYPELPLSPVSMRPMRFLCQFGGGNPGLPNEVETDEGYIQDHLETLEFWSLGELYVFFDPDNQILCLHPQST